MNWDMVFDIVALIAGAALIAAHFQSLPVGLGVFIISMTLGKGVGR